MHISDETQEKERNQSDDLRTIQLAELNIMRSILPILQKYDLKYFMLGGTLLGAVRHQGFIPWDDDMDIGMPRPDYEQFLQIVEKELEAPFQLHTFFSGTSEYSYYYARVEDKSLLLRRSASAITVLVPVWIDVFPLDGVPDNRLHFKIWKQYCSHNLKWFSYSQLKYFIPTTRARSGIIGGIMYYSKLVFFKLNVEDYLNTEHFWKRLDRGLKSVDYESASRLINYCGAWHFKEMFPKSVYGKGKLYPFEDLMLMGPVDYDYVLTQMYGDYMTPPPVENRDRHKIRLVKDQ